MNKHKIYLSKPGYCIALGILLLLSGCSGGRRDALFQVCTLDALASGVYDGSFSCRDLLRHGNLGVGTFDALDGEMMVLDGKLYQIKSDGKVYRPRLSALTPFATICDFSADLSFNIDSLSDLIGIEKLIDRYAPNQNLTCAYKIDGKFKMMRTRSVPRQNKPYPTLVEVAANQPEFRMENVSGTIFGFRFPAYMKGLNMTGYHLHFLSSDRTQAGHILDLELISGKCEVDILTRVVVQLPEKDPAFAATDLSKDRSLELQKAEGSGNGRDKHD